MAQNYSVQRSDIERIYDDAAKLVKNGADWLRVCETILPRITHIFDHEGEQLPENDTQIIVATTHPSHFDYFFAAQGLQQRPDLKMVARVPTETQEKFPGRRSFLTASAQIIPLHSQEIAGYVHDSITDLSKKMQQGVSVIVVPWGCMDGQAEKQSSEEAAIKNIMHLSRKTGALVVPAEIAIESNTDESWPGPLPFKRVKVTTHEAIPADDTASIENAIASLYRNATR